MSQAAPSIPGVQLEATRSTSKAKPSRARKIVQRTVIALASVMVLLTGVIGFAHTKTGRPLLRYIPGMGGVCPLGMDVKLAPAQRDSLRNQTLAKYRGEQPAASRVVYGFELGKSSRADVDTWTKSNGVACEPKKRDNGIDCKGVPAAAVGGIEAAESIGFLFDAHDAVVAIDLHRSLSPERAIAVIDAQSLILKASLGPSTSDRNAHTPAYLTDGKLRQVLVEFAYHDVLAKVMATNVGSTIHQRETYQLVGDPS